MIKILAVFFFIISSAFVYAGPLPRKGYQINPSYESIGNGIFHAGQTVTFKGSICKEEPWNQNYGCGKIHPNEIEFKAYYPDFLHEVTSQVALTSAPNGKSINYEFTTQAVGNNFENKFIIQIGKTSDKVAGLQKSLAKFNSIILHIQAKIVFFQDNPNPRPGFDKVIKLLEKNLHFFQKLAALVQLKIEYHSESFAEFHQPISVDNGLSASFYKLTKFDGFKIITEAVTGILIEGEKTTVRNRIINELHKPYSFLFDDDHFQNGMFEDSNKYRAEFYFNGQLIHEISPSSVVQGETLSFEYDLVGSAISNVDLFKTVLFERKKSFFWWTEKRIGRLESGFYLNPDEVAPVWNIASLIPKDEELYLNSIPEIYGELTDSLGRLNEGSIRVILQGETNSGETVNIPLDILKSLDDAQKVAVISRSKSSFPSGNYSLIFQAQDLANNFAIPENLTRVFTIDVDPPIIFLDQLGQIYTNQENFNVSGIVQDNALRDVKIVAAGETIESTTNNSFSFLVGLIPFKNVFTIEATDKADNKSSTTFEITLDTTLPTLSSSVPDGAISISRRPEMVIGLSDDLSGIRLSSVVALINGVDKTDQFVISLSDIRSNFTQDLDFGLTNFVFKVEDMAGNLQELSFSMTLGMMPPEIAITNPLSGQVLATLEPELTVSFSGQGLDLGTFKTLIDSVDVTAHFTMSGNSATWAAAQGLSEGPHTFSVSISNTAQMTTTDSLSFIIDLPEEVPPPPTPTPAPPSVAIEDISPTEGGSVAISDPQSPAFGASISIASGTLEEGTQISISTAVPSSIPPSNNPEDPAYDYYGPVMKFEASKSYSEEKTFKEPVIVTIPFNANAVKSVGGSDNLFVMRYSSQKNEFEIIEPFLIDDKSGVLFATTDKFSYFCPGWRPPPNYYYPPYYDQPICPTYSSPSITYTAPTNCVRVQSGKFCQITDSTYVISGSYKASNITGATSTDALDLQCKNCPGLINVEKTLVSDTCGKKWIDFRIEGTLPNDMSPVEVEFRSVDRYGGIWLITEREVFNIIEPFTLPPPPPSSTAACDQFGIICNYLGNGTVGVSPDGSTADESPINIGFTQYKLIALDTDSQGRLLWVEPASTYILPDGNRELVLRRVRIDGTIETLFNFQVKTRNTTILTDLNFKIEAAQEVLYIAVQNQDIASMTFPVAKFHYTFLDSEAAILKIALSDYSVQVLPKNGAGFDFMNSIASKADGTLYVKGAVTVINGGLYQTFSVNDGIHKFDPATNQWTFLTRNKTTTYVSIPDQMPIATTTYGDGASLDVGTHIANYIGDKAYELNFYSNELYMTLPQYQCIRKFNSNWILENVAGQCSTVIATPNGEEIDALVAILGRVATLKFDPLGNLFFSEQKPIRRFRVMRAGDKKIKTIVGGGTTPLTFDAMPIDSLQIELPIVSTEESAHNAFALDIDGNFYGLGQNFIYRISNPLLERTGGGTGGLATSDPIAMPISNVSLTTEQLNLNNMIKILETSQSNDGYWDFEESYLGDIYQNDDAARRLISTANALEIFESSGLTDTLTVDKALTWLAEQEYESTSLVAKQLDVISKFKSYDSRLGSVRTARQNFLRQLGDSYRPELFGWGSDKNTVTNNLDTAEALRALSIVHSTFSLQQLSQPILMSNYIIVINKVLNKQFDVTFGPANGGWGYYGPENPPTFMTTAKVVEALMAYRKLPQDVDAIISPDNRSDFIDLKNTRIPPAIESALQFLLSYKRPDGSFGDVGQTASMIKLIKQIIEEGITANAQLLASLQSGLTDAIAFLTGQNLTIYDAGNLALLSNSLNALNRTIALDQASTPEIIPLPGEISDPELGNGKDGALVASGIFNLNVHKTRMRVRPDGVALPVSAILSATQLAVNDAVKDDLAPGDEILLISMQGNENAGAYEFKKVLSFDASISPALVTLESTIEHPFSLNDKLILQRIPQYTKVDSSANLTITANPWNGKTGGIVAFRVVGAITNKVSINATGLGLRGGGSKIENGVYLSAQGESINALGSLSNQALGNNGCAGGNAVLTQFAGGGGSYGGLATLMSGQTFAASDGIIIGQSDLGKIFIGCGGGSGIALDIDTVKSEGGNGGGIIIVMADQLTLGQNKIEANGQGGSEGIGYLYPGYGAGGGSGGTILLTVKNLITQADKIEALGGGGSIGSAEAAGHRGGHGRIRINYVELNSIVFPGGGSGESTVLQTNPAAFGGEF